MGNICSPRESEGDGLGRRELLRNAISFAALFSFFGGRALAHTTCEDTANPAFNIERYQTNHYGRVDVFADPVYATPRNFTGAPVEGYEAEKVWLPADGIERLMEQVLPEVRREIERKLLERGTKKEESVGWVEDIVLIVKDGYRPHRASDALGRVAAQQGIASGYVASGISDHNRMGEDAYTVDLTLGVKIDITKLFADATYANGSTIEVREAWMGAHFDEFNENASHGVAGRTKPTATDKALAYKGNALWVSLLTPLELKNILKAAMQKAGFASYGKEFWHYTRMPSGAENVPCYDRPIR